MGKPSNKTKNSLGDTGDAVSLHSNVAPDRGQSISPAGAAGSSRSNQYRDRGFPDDDDDVPQLGSHDDDDDLPPLYTDVAESNSLLPPQQAPAAPSDDAHASNLVPTFFVDQKNGCEVYINPWLDSSPELLERHVESWANRPPRLFVQVRGIHREMVEEHGKRERKPVVDFDVRVDLTPYLYQNVAARTSWSFIETVENYERARRGTVFARRAQGVALDEGAPRPTLREWLHRYCAGSSSGLKAFVLRRDVVGLRRELMRDRLIQLVRSTNYQGDVQVHFPCHNETVSVYNSCRTNRLRFTNWVRILCYVTLTFLLTWPYLFFRTKRFETVSVVWPFSNLDVDGNRVYVSLSEEQLLGLWGRSIHTAVLSKRQCTLDEQDLANANSRQGPVLTGNTAVDAGIDAVMAGMRAMNEVNMQIGWGYDR